jgi:hypothetical protein
MISALLNPECLYLSNAYVIYSYSVKIVASEVDFAYASEKSFNGVDA